MLSSLAAAATFSTSVYRELDAAGRAYLEEGDPAPLLRIASEQNVPGDAGDLADSSEGLYAAVICNDYPQLWDITSPLGTRPAAVRRGRRRAEGDHAGRVRPLHHRRVAGLAVDGVRELHRLAPAVHLGPGGPRAGRLSRRPGARAGGRSRHDHIARGLADRGRQLPPLDVRRGRQHDPRDGAGRLLAVRVGHRRALRGDGRRCRRHVVRGRLPGGAHGRGVPRAPAGRHTGAGSGHRPHGQGRHGRRPDRRRHDRPVVVDVRRSRRRPARRAPSRRPASTT